jgi:hypothetical protein
MLAKRSAPSKLRVYLVKLMQQLQLQVHHRAVPNGSFKTSSFTKSGVKKRLIQGAKKSSSQYLLLHVMIFVDQKYP